MGILRLLRLISILALLIGGGLALWRRRGAVKQTWDSLGGVEGIKGSASKLMSSVGPVKELFSQVSRTK